MNIRRVVPDVSSEHLAESRDFYAGFLGFQVAMDMGWVMTFASKSNPTAQVTVIDAEKAGAVRPQMSIEVDDVDRAHALAVKQNRNIVYPLVDEPWGVRRFFVVDPNGVVINVLSHKASGTPSRKARTPARRTTRKATSNRRRRPAR